MVFLRPALAAIGVVSTLAFASPADPRTGAEYTTLARKMDVKGRAKDDAIIEWVGKNGVDKAAFLAAWNSFGVATALRRLPRMIGEYHVDSAPTLVVNGRFVTSPAQAASRSVDQSPAAEKKAVLGVLDALVAEARAETAAMQK